MRNYSCVLVCSLALGVAAGCKPDIDCPEGLVLMGDSCVAAEPMPEGDGAAPAPDGGISEGDGGGSDAGGSPSPASPNASSTGA